MPLRNLSFEGILDNVSFLPPCQVCGVLELDPAANFPVQWVRLELALAPLLWGAGLWCATPRWLYEWRLVLPPAPRHLRI